VPPDPKIPINSRARNYIGDHLLLRVNFYTLQKSSYFSRYSKLDSKINSTKSRGRLLYDYKIAYFTLLQYCAKQVDIYT